MRCSRCGGILEWRMNCYVCRQCGAVLNVRK